jgi:hypothetical protein
MILIAHILIALTSLGFSLFVYVAPSRQRLHISYGLVAATIISGTALVLQSAGHMLEACTMGLLFVGVSLVAAAAAHRKLAVQHD